VLGFLIFFAGPLLFSLFVSFTSWDAFGPKIWIGLDNYIRIFSLDIAHLASGSQPAGEVLKDGYNELFRLGDFVIGARDKLFWISIRNILVFAALAIPLAVAPALLLANILNSRIPGMKFFRAIYFIPSIAGVVGIALVWRQLFNATVGFINFFITKAVGFLDALPLITVQDPNIKWLSDSSTALIAVVIVFSWQMVGFNTVLYLAGLQGIPRDLYEAATIDGANTWQRFRYITIPMLTPTTFFVVASTSILALQLFTEPFIMFSPASGPNNATLTPVVYLYQQGFQRFSQGYASAVAWVLFGMIFVFTLAQFRRQRDADGAYGAA
jgi:ABC-type sugar transport system permease subunit